MTQLTDDDMLELENFAGAFLPSRGMVLFRAVMHELRERRAADLSDEDISALRMVFVMLREDDDVKLRYGWQQRYGNAVAVLSRLLGTKEGT